MVNKIAFPGLRIGTFSISEYFTVFGFKIHWYGVIIALGVVLGFLLASKDAKRRGLHADTMSNILLWGLPSAIICARAYYVIFEFDLYKNDILSIFKIWEGGIAIYGAIIGAIISTYIYTKCKKISFLKTIDSGAFGLLVGQIIGRWGNFVNAEAYGKETDSFLKMELVNKAICVHPTFLYESLWNVLVLAFLLFYRKKQKFDGENFCIYASLYGLGRFWIEGLRQDSLFLGPIRISQLIAGVCFVLGMVIIFYKRRNSGDKI